MPHQLSIFEMILKTNPRTRVDVSKPGIAVPSMRKDCFEPIIHTQLFTVAYTCQHILIKHILVKIQKGNNCNYYKN